MSKFIIIGAGPAGIGAAYILNKKGYSVLLLDERDCYGGLCSYFKVGDYIFDRFVHVSFAQDKQIIDLYKKSGDFEKIKPIMYNRYKDLWIPHPVQDNLSYLPLTIRVKILLSFLTKKNYNIDNYAHWLYNNYGKFFSKEFPFKYTNLYWQMQPKDMETSWIGNRISNTTFLNLLKNSFFHKENINYYAKEFNYPKKGGFSSFFDYMANDLNFIYNSKVVKIDTKEKEVMTDSGEKYNYDILINTSPLKDLANIVVESSYEIKNRSKLLSHTSGYIVSIGLNKEPIAQNSIFFYNYNKDLLAARVYFPHKKTLTNCPKGCYSLQIEIYTKNGNRLDTASKSFQDTINKVLSYCLLDKTNIVFQDIRYEKYANIIFDKNIYQVRKELLEYFNSKDIISIGRFGSWDYLWSFQALKQGLDLGDKF